MLNILRVELFRCTRNWLFLLGILLSALLGWSAGAASTEWTIYQVLIEAPLFVFAVGLTFLLAIHLTRENDHRTVNQMLIAGYTRGQLLRGRLIFCFLCSTLYTCIMLLFFAFSAYESFLQYLPTNTKLLVLVDIILLNLVWAAVITVLCSVFTKKGTGMVISLLFIMWVSIFSKYAKTQLKFPKYTITTQNNYIEMTADEIQKVREHTYHDGQYIIEKDLQRNLTYYKVEVLTIQNEHHLYVKPPKRYVLLLADKCLPLSHARHFDDYLAYELHKNYFMEEKNFDYIQWFPLYSFCTIIVIASIGAITFSKKRFQ